MYWKAFFLFIRIIHILYRKKREFKKSIYYKNYNKVTASNKISFFSSYLLFFFTIFLMYILYLILETILFNWNHTTKQ